MKYIFVILLLFSSFASADDNINQQLKDTPEMSARCITKINYYSDKVSDYQLKLHLSPGQKLKLQYYESELLSWEEYCNGDYFDQDIAE